ncbi:hypothetical protein [Leisingera methylohalidivorans]|uniref:Uncharacterized protein n=1 Tax=Leisingera methylohalidivorans DSM 14336 TaxID=999552 RepID=V9VYW2_9RHOB|nr:hypothetical protein [Leisingera methylohalidivorans]AHD02944.1 hypothetical protein METH_06850 [Leisingera methylohalidivorans DSM 14336]
MSGFDIAEEIAAALAEAGEAVGDGPMMCTLKRAGEGDKLNPRNVGADGRPVRPVDTFHELVAVQGFQQVRDASGTLLTQQIRKVTVNATGVEPRDGDTIAIGVAMADAAEDTKYTRIEKVTPFAPGGTALSYDLELKS